METTSCDLDGSATSDIRFNVSRLVGRKRGVRILHSDSRSAIPRGSGLRLRGRRGIRRRDRLRRRGWSDRTVRRHGGLGGLDGSGLVGSRSDRRGGRLRSRARCRSRPTRLRLLNGGRESSCRSRLRLDGRRLRRIRHPNGRRHGIAGRNGRSRLNRNASRSHGSATGRLNRNGRRLRSRTSGRRGLNRSAGRSGRRAAGRLDRNGGARLSRNGSRLDTQRASHTSRNSGTRLARIRNTGRSGLDRNAGRSGRSATGRDGRLSGSRLNRAIGRLDAQRASHTSRNGGHVRGGIRGSFPARHGRRGDGHAGLGT